MRTEVIFSRKTDAQKVVRRLRDFSVLSRVVGREVWIEVPTASTPSAMFDLAKRLHREMNA